MSYISQYFQHLFIFPQHHDQQCCEQNQLPDFPHISLFSSIQFLPSLSILSNPLFLSRSDPFQQLNNRQIQKRKAIYSHQLCYRQCLHFEHSLKCRDHQYACNQKPAKYKCSNQINVIPESSFEDDWFIAYS